jgi:hypothetical protein
MCEERKTDWKRIRAAAAGEIAPTCETCPLWGTAEMSEAGANRRWCLHTGNQAAQEASGLGMMAGWFCEHHTLYPAWAIGECLRRVQRAKGGER